MARKPVSKAADPYTDSSGAWPIPQFDAGMTFRDVGSSGLRQFGGYLREEFLPQLQGRQAARVYREMSDNSAVVGALLFAIIQAMRKVEWRTVAASDKPEAVADQEFAESLRFDMAHTWEDFIAEALSMLTYGYAPHEIVYKRRNGRKPQNSPNANAGAMPASSDYDDGRIGIRKLPIRGQDTVLKWFFGTGGTILGLTQQPWVGPLIDLPIEKLLLFRPTQHKGNPEGRSVLRTAYRSYYFTKRLEEQQAIALERMSGVPEVDVPNQLLEAAANGDSKAVAALNAWKKLATNVRIDEQMGLVLPSDRYPGTNGGASTERMYEFRLIVPNGRIAADFEAPLARYALNIMMTVLADFVTLGHGTRGTQALAIEKVDMFMSALEGWLNSIAAVLNRHLLPRVWMLNGLDLATMPEYEPDLSKRMDLDVLSNFVLRLSQAGMPLFPDEDVETYLRDAAGLPDIAEDSAYADAAAAGALPAADLTKMLAATLAKRMKTARRPVELRTRRKGSGA